MVDEIIEGGHITPVYQPIVSLADGTVYGYEALSRISADELQMDIDTMFRIAGRMNCSWKLEALCRDRALENAAGLGSDKKLFLNVNPGIMYDEDFRAGFTKNRIEAYGMNAENIIFEVTERSSITDSEVFLKSIDHYKAQRYTVAIDDVGAGFSGLNTIAGVRPHIMKLDMNLVRDIDKDEIKQLLCRAMIDFGRNAGIKVVAEGIETEAELKTLIRLKAEYGQGFFLGIPQETFCGVAPEKQAIISKHHEKLYAETIRSSVYPIVGYLSRPGHTFSPEQRMDDIYETLRLNPTITEFAVLEDGNAIGFMTRADLNAQFAGRYGYSLYANKLLKRLMKTNFMRVNYRMPVDHVSRLAMQRPFEQLYNPIIIEKENKYHGIATVQDLLNTCSKVEINLVKHSNPLTGLPGNLLIEKEILNRLFGEAPYCITYYDVDNFKAYNDAYGFDNGDKMLSLVADILRRCATRQEFIGHIGGDDFIVICDYAGGETYCRLVLDAFAAEVPALYRDEDVKNGYIVSKNRSGVTENFPIASLSIAGISSNYMRYNNIDAFSHDIAQLKKKCKQHLGNYLEIL